MLRLVLLLLVTLVLFPVCAFFFDQPLTAAEIGVLWGSAYLMIGFATASFVVSEISKNYSQTDKLWSVTPIFYTWFLAFQGDFDARLVLMAVVATVWGARLTYNFGRRGGYHIQFWKGEEDYRWAILRQTPAFSKPWAWSLFNLFFISFYQHALIWLFTLPALLAWGAKGIPLNGLDFLAAILILVLVAVEFMADQQQYDFQTEKYRRKNASEPLDGEYLQGFRSSGLWAWARHPNYAAEQGIWLAFYVFSVAATGRWFNWTLAGALLLLLLFKGSSDFSEKISAEKYPDYPEYQRRVGRFFPKISQLMGDSRTQKS